MTSMGNFAVNSPRPCVANALRRWCEAKPPQQKSKWPTRMRIIGFLIALLILITGAAIWIWNSLNSVPALLTTIFGVLATIFTFLQLIPVIFPQNHLSLL